MSDDSEQKFGRVPMAVLPIIGLGFYPISLALKSGNMVSIPENLKLDVACPDCGKMAHQSLVRLRRRKQFRCIGCGQTVRITGDGFANLEAAVAAFGIEVAKVEFFIYSKQ